MLNRLTYILFAFILLTPVLSQANQQQDYQKRVAWVSHLREFLQDLDSANPQSIFVKTKFNYFNKLSLFQEAFAEEKHECFFAGWPSSLVTSGGRKLCQNPLSGNSDYQKGNCESGELQCQPLLFGKGVCVGFANKKDKQMAFAACERKFTKAGNNDFLKTLTNEDKAALKEISMLAHQICVTGKIGIQKSKPMCANLVSKFSESMNAIERAPASIPEEDDKVITQVTEGKLKSLDFSGSLKNELVCEEPTSTNREIIHESEKIIGIVNHDGNKLYDEIKTEFLKSPLCSPDKVLNNPQDKLSPLLLSQLLEDTRFMIQSGPETSRTSKNNRFLELAKQYELSQETVDYGLSLISNYADTNEGRYDAMARLRGVVLQDMDKISKRMPNYQNEFLKEELMNRKIFIENDEGFPECPFISADAFNRALAGREDVLKSPHKSKITNPNLLTIVDYTRPSNERRMYVIDLVSKKVLHNTWTAHGGGKDRSQDLGVDGFGSSPKTSNDPGSLLSSEGFYIAKQASTGSTYLNNVTLEGIDVQNSTMASRAIVVHGWRTPNHEYVNKSWVISEATNRRIAGKDIYREFMSVDFKNTKEDLFNLTQDISSAAASRERVDATDGCLGVPDTNIKHLDRKGRDKSQLELLRLDLPGSLMFNYVGPDTKSKY